MTDAFKRLRLPALVWLAVYLPSYAAAYGFANFVFLCNLGVTHRALLATLPQHRPSP